MAFVEDNTTVIRMKRDFDQFLKDSPVGQGVSAFNIEDTTEQRNNNSYDGPVMSLNALLEKDRESKLKAAEAIAAKSQILQLESRINALETSNKRARIEFDQEIKKEKEKESVTQKELNKVKMQMKFLADKEAMMRQELAESRKEFESQRKSYETKLLSIQKENLELSDKIQQEKEKLSELRHEVFRCQTELNMSQCDLEEKKQQLEMLQLKCSDASTQAKEVEDLRLKSLEAEQTIKSLELKISRMEGDCTMGRALKSQMLTFKEMESENRKLKDDNQYLRDVQENTLLLKEQNEGMKKKIQRLEEKMEEYSRLLLENEELKKKLQRWEEAGKGGPPLSSPTQLCKRIEDLQRSEAIMLSKQGTLQSSLHSKERLVLVQQEQLQAVTTQLALEKEKGQQKADFIKRLQKKLLLLSQDRDANKNLLKSYESGEAVGEKVRVQQLEESCRAHQKQAEFLESENNRLSQELLSAKQDVKQLELQVTDLQRSSQVKRQSTDAADEQIMVHLREKIATLEKSLEKCESEKFNLECRIEQRHLQGDYDPTKVKVLHFEMNPVAIAQAQRAAELGQLREENERLKERVKILEEEGKMEDLTVTVEKRLQEPGSSKDIQEMQAQLKSAEMKNKRLMEAFKETSQEFREVCYLLTGYQIDIPTSRQYKLTSMYAESPSDFLLFKRSSSGEIQMLGTEFSSSMQDLITTYLQHQNSVPAFTSSVTLELHSRQTMDLG